MSQMKYIEIVSRNVYIPNSFQQKLAQFKDACTNQNAKHWVDTVFRRFIIGYYDASPIRKTSSVYPKWVNDNINQGKEVLILSDIKLDELLHYADFLNTLSSTKDLTRMSFDQFVKKLSEWEHSFKNAKDEEDGITEIMIIGEYTWVEITGRRSLKREGKLMNHCVGGYYEDVASNKCKIYSLRHNTKPLVTVEYRNKNITQIRGNSNQPINPKYVDMVVLFLNSLNVKNYNIRNLNANYMVIINKKVKSLMKLSNTDIISEFYYSDNITLPKNITIKYLEVNYCTVTLKDCIIHVLETSNSDLTIECNITRAMYAEFCKLPKLPKNINILELNQCLIPNKVSLNAEDRKSVV